MKKSNQFLNTILDSISEHIVVIDYAGNIVYVNESWKKFASNNNCTIDSYWDHINYLSECENAAKRGDLFALTALEGIKLVLKGIKDSFDFEYPCHGPHEKRWFLMQVTPCNIENNSYFVITHKNITKRKLAENAVQELARTDGLTKVANRRAFDQVLNHIYRRYMRMEQPITLLMIDLDYFKTLNDTYGHQVGDKCLQEVAQILANFANRADDLCARYGGEEFAIIWGGTTLDQAKLLAQKILKTISDLKFPNKNAPKNKFLTASIGIAQMVPPRNSTELVLIHRADEKLYLAKKNGRNRIEY